MRDFLLVAKALANPTRARILKLLEQGEMCVCDIIGVIGLKQSTISKQLNILKNAGLIEDTRKGTWAFYKLEKNVINKYNLIINTMMRKCLNEEETIKKDKDKFLSVRCCNLKL